MKIGIFHRFQFTVLTIVTRRIGTKIDTIRVDQVPAIMIAAITIRMSTAAMGTTIVIQSISIRLEVEAVLEAVAVPALEAVDMMRAHTMVIFIAK